MFSVLVMRWIGEKPYGCRKADPVFELESREAVMAFLAENKCETVFNSYPEGKVFTGNDLIISVTGL